jgi:DNA-directed RNA polymerase specialized sigma24 family protein
VPTPAATRPTPLHRISDAAAGDPSALAALARAVAPVLEAHARRALPRPSAAASDVLEDAVADVQAFLAAGPDGTPGWARFDARRGRADLGAWLYGIVRNKVRRRLRDARRDDTLADPAAACAVPAAAPARSPERALDGARALRLVASLPPRERAVLRLWLDDAPAREIARRLRLASPHAADCCLSRGKQRLRRLMEGGARAA